MRTLALSSEGDPLFVRDERGLDYEIEVCWVTDARFRDWADDGATPWDAVWDRVSKEFVQGTVREVSVDWMKVRGYLSADPLLVKPALRILTAYHLPRLEDRAEQQLRARAVERLGGEVVDEITLRREDAEDARWHQRHPKARPSHPSVWLPQSYQAPIKVERRTIPFMEMSLPVETLDEAHTRRAEALKRLQDPKAIDAETVQHFLNGLVSRPVA